MEKRNWAALILTNAVLLLLLTGCGGLSGRAGEGAAQGKETVTIALWSDELTEHYGKYLQEKFPEVEFEFYVATNSTDFYRFKEERGDLPDILTVRRFSLNDVSPWKDSLMDLSGSELAATFHPSYLYSYTYYDGTINWLPACAEVDGILVNRALLEENHLPLPTNYGEFVQTCAALRELGIRPFRSNFNADYTCMEILQGLSLTQMTSQAGREWRQLYESGQTDRLDGEVWLPAFARMGEFIAYTGLGPSDLEGDTAAVFEAYKNHEVAMIRGTSGEAKWYGVEEESILVPYYGETEEDNWYLTYPAFQVAASARAEESPEREKLILDILEAMLNQEGLQQIAGENIIAYNKGTAVSLSPMQEQMQACMDGNRLYIRLASSGMFSASRQVVQGMLTGDYPDAQSAFDAFNEAMAADSRQDPVAAHIDTGYSYTFDPDGGSPAASAVMNSLREELGAQLLVGQSVNVAGNISAGDYTAAELRFLTMGESIDILRCRITGEQLYAYLSQVLAAAGRRGSVINDSTLYVSSGFEMEIEKTDTGYVLHTLTIDGEELEPGQSYDLAVLGNELIMHRDLLAAAGITQYTKEEESFKQLIVDRLTRGGQLAAPTAYLTLI